MLSAFYIFPLMADNEEVWDLLRYGNLSTVTPLFEKSDSDLLNVVDQVLLHFPFTLVITSNTLSKGGNTPLHISAAWGFHDICRFLIRKGARVAAINTRGFTPLHWAAMNGHEIVCAMLIEANSPIREDMVRSGKIHMHHDFIIHSMTLEKANTTSFSLCEWSCWRGQFISALGGFVASCG